MPLGGSTSQLVDARADGILLADEQLAVARLDEAHRLQLTGRVRGTSTVTLLGRATAGADVSGVGCVRVEVR